MFFEKTRIKKALTAARISPAVLNSFETIVSDFRRHGYIDSSGGARRGDSLLIFECYRTEQLDMMTENIAREYRDKLKAIQSNLPTVMINTISAASSHLIQYRVRIQTMGVYRHDLKRASQELFYHVYASSPLYIGLIEFMKKPNSLRLPKIEVGKRSRRNYPMTFLRVQEPDIYEFEAASYEPFNFETISMLGQMPGCVESELAYAVGKVCYDFAEAIGLHKD